MRVSHEQAVFPQVIRLLYAGEVLLLVAVTTVVVSVMALNVFATDLYRYTVSFHALSLLARYVASGTGLAASLGGYDLSTPGRALVVLLIYGCGLTLAAVLVFRQQDLMLKV